MIFLLLTLTSQNILNKNPKNGQKIPQLLLAYSHDETMKDNM